MKKIIFPSKNKPAVVIENLDPNQMNLFTVNKKALLKRRPALIGINDKGQRQIRARSEKEMFLPSSIQSDQLTVFSHLQGEHLWGRICFNHFGHFLMESLAVVYYLKRTPSFKGKLLWTMQGTDKTSLNKWQTELCSLLDIKERVKIISEPTSVESLKIIEPGFMIATSLIKEQKEALAVCQGQPPKKGKKIWLSRSKLTSQNITNALEIEPILEAAGWELYHPQDHSIADQITHIRDAEIVAGFEGSAFYLFMLIDNFQGTVVCIPRYGGLNGNLDLIKQAYALTLKEIYIPYEEVYSPKDEGKLQRHMNYKVKNIEKLTAYMLNF
ncbi:glycosyltransferase family 61 protein [Temperatibacter marinus]|uniref:Glycosyltransferase family 61 protein n=1 Tax=Temperatibacter marinus TaxID=1456591 RepID=A0AA52EL95_9PROT|nr:glycosyltransferase family 61 protein [Temperatibacter marinus]WND04091.1 glycosyltransferase family 61 protein [Temperatibacter marinus]